MKIVFLFVCLAIGGTVVETIGGRVKRISGGYEMQIEMVPYVVSLRRSGRHVCCGALISMQHVLTAAHCVALGPKYLNQMTVVSGTDKMDRTDIGHPIKNITIHEEFQEGRYWCDIAVITLSTHVQRNPRQREIALPNARPPYGKHATLSAFKYREVDEDTKHGLRQVTMVIHETIQTSTNADYYDQVFRATFRFGPNIAAADCGAPLVNGGTIIGMLVKYSRNHAECYFVNVVKFITFIKKSMAEESSLNSERPSAMSSSSMGEERSLNSERPSAMSSSSMGEERSLNSERPSVIKWTPKRSRLEPSTISTPVVF